MTAQIFNDEYDGVYMRPELSFTAAARALFQNYARFSGRAGRLEFWYALVVVMAVNALLSVLGQVFEQSFTVFMLSTMWFFVIFLPMVGLQVRRLHDTNRSGWWVLLNFMLGFGQLMLVFFYIGDSNPAGVRFDAKDGSQPALGD